MCTSIRPEISKANDYWISKERYYELKHFCLQYNDWLRIYRELCDSRLGVSIKENRAFISEICNPTEKLAIIKLHYRERIEMVQRAAEMCDDDISAYVLKAVTDNISCNCLIMKYGMPCGKDKFYDAYRRFFWQLSQFRD